MVYKNTPNNDLPTLPPAYVFDDIDILKKTNKANKAVSELNGLIRTLENSEIILGPLKVKEAVESSGIENINTTMSEALQAELFSPDNLSQEQKETQNYKKALLLGFEKIKDLGFLKTANILEIQACLGIPHLGIRSLSGTKIGNRQTGEIFYTPPEGQKLLKDLLKNFEEYYNDSSNDPDFLIKMAILHYQFEAIHPFFDGNGRTGRIIMVLYLVLQGSLISPTFFISQYINRNRNEYYRLLREVTFKNNWKDWVLFILDASEKQALETKRTILEILELKKKFKDEVLPRFKFTYSMELLDYIFSNGFYTHSQLLKNTAIKSKNTAPEYLNSLLKDGILKVIESKSKEKVYYYPEFLKILE